MMRQPLARFSQCELAGNALEQRQPDSFLQLPDLHGDRRLRQVQFLGGARKARIPAGDHEDLQLSQGQRANKVHYGRPSCKPALCGSFDYRTSSNFIKLQKPSE
jgi:hypothetical protein